MFMQGNFFLMTCINYWQQLPHRYFYKISVLVLARKWGNLGISGTRLALSLLQSKIVTHVHIFLPLIDNTQAS